MNFFNDNLSSMEKTTYCERYINNGSPSGFTFINTTSVGTRAYDKVKSIKVPVIEFCSDEKLAFYGDKLNFIADNQLIIHPDMQNIFSDDANVKRIDFIDAVPLASQRTVFIPKFNKYLKLQYNKLIGRIERFISYNHVKHAMAVNKILHELDWMNSPLHFFPEEHARIYRQNNGSTIGMLVRDVCVMPKVDGIIVPAFSLFSTDKNSPQDKSILLQLIDRTTKDKDEFIFSGFIEPVISLFFKILLETGLQIEAHAQNICYIISDDCIDIAVRDFESMDKDLEIVPALNNCFNSEYKCLDKTSKDYVKRHSFMFDFKLGEYLITPVLNEAAKAGCDIEFIIDRIRLLVNSFIKLLPDGFFPKNCWYSFPKQLIDRTTDSRPYEERPCPKYR